MSQWQSIEKLAIQVNSGKLKAIDLVEKSLSIIEINKEFDAIISVMDNRARQRATEIDEKISNGQNAGRLAGVPFIAKDNFLTLGSTTTAASNMLKNFKAPYQATVIEKLEAEGAICVAKANLDAFAHGSSTENSDFMVTKNPHDTSRVAGGSSGGSAAAVMLDMAPFALGSDTGGSIRQPAAFCGAVGYKPTYGLVSRNGVVAMASSTDVIGPIAQSVGDAAFVLDVIAGKDSYDSTTIDRQEIYSIADQSLDLVGKKFGLVREYMGEGIDETIRNSVLSVAQKLKSAGAIVEEISIPSLPLALASYYIIMPAEVSSNMSRYDGQRYGLSAKNAKSLDESITMSRSEGLNKENKRRIMIGAYVLSSGFYDAYFHKAQQLRTKLISEFDKAFKQVEFLIGPTTPSTAFTIGTKIKDPLQMYLGDIMTVGASLVGIPAISVPNGADDGMPIGLQIMADRKRDKELLNIAKSVKEL